MALLTIGMGISAAVGYDFGKEVSKKSVSELIGNFKQLKWQKKSLILIFTSAVLFGLYLNINPPKINNKALTQATEIAEHVSINFASGFAATIVLKKAYALTTNSTEMAPVELDNLKDARELKTITEEE